MTRAAPHGDGPGHTRDYRTKHFWAELLDPVEDKKAWALVMVRAAFQGHGVYCGVCPCSDVAHGGRQRDRERLG
jgi:hypothetical protein